MISKYGALKGGMPLYKFIGNKILTFLQNKILGSNLSEFHSGYRIYDVKALNNIPFELNSNDFSFDTEIIIQFLICKYKISEFSIPTFYGKEISYVNGLHYAYRIIVESLKANIQKLGLFYEKKYDLKQDEVNYIFKKNFLSTHSLSLKKIKENSTVLDIGCNQGDLIEYLAEKKNCKVVGIDKNETSVSSKVHEYLSCDLNKELPNLDYNKFDYVIFDTAGTDPKEVGFSMCNVDIQTDDVAKVCIDANSGVCHVDIITTPPDSFSCNDYPITVIMIDKQLEGNDLLLDILPTFQATAYNRFHAFFLS